MKKMLKEFFQKIFPSLHERIVENASEKRFSNFIFEKPLSEIKPGDILLLSTQVRSWFGMPFLTYRPIQVKSLEKRGNAIFCEGEWPLEIQTVEESKFFKKSFWGAFGSAETIEVVSRITKECSGTFHGWLTEKSAVKCLKINFQQLESFIQNPRPKLAV